MLLISGQIFCGIFGLAIMVGAQIGTGRENIRKLRLPFLPFLLPASLWMVLMRIMRKTTCIKKYYSASITVEASIILSVVLLSLAAFIRYAYTVHDTVTGSMILEETLERARNNVNEKKTIDSFEQEGSQMGNPRLYLGAYELHLNLGALSAEGDAAAGDWSLHIERADIHPETFLRQQDALKKIKDRIDD